MSGAPLLDPTSVPDTIRAKRIELMGQYAIQISWTDNHDSGIYNFRDLRRNCPCADCETIRAAGGIPA
jgi:ATP-binding protein involved in chromosome partitioning